MTHPAAWEPDRSHLFSPLLPFSRVLPAPRHHERVQAVALTLAAYAAATLLLLLPAFWNGYPLIYYDTVDYVRMPYTGVVPLFRTGSMVLFTAIAVPFNSLWPIIVLQGVLVVHVLHEALAVFVPQRRPAPLLVGVTLALTVFTGLPWFTSQILADAFTGSVVLGVATLAFGARRLGTVRAVGLAIILMGMTAAHTTHIGIVAGLALCCGALHLLATYRGRAWTVLRAGWRGPLAVLLGAVLFAVGANWALTGRIFISQPNHVLLLARLVQDGIAKRYLDAECPHNTTLRLCAVREQLPPTANDFLWGRSPFHQLGGWEGLESEAEQILEGSLAQLPARHALTALRLTGIQLAMVRTGDGLVPMDWHIRRTLETFFPYEAQSYLEAEQRTGIDFSLLNDLHVPVAYIGYAGLLLLFAVAWWRGDRRGAGLCLLVLLALLGNAFICGALSNPLDRYQGRLVWVPVLTVALAIARLEYRRSRITARSLLSVLA